MWSSAHINLIGEYSFKALCVLSGTFIVWIGASLFKAGVFKGGAELTWKQVVSVGKGGPGLVFAALGTAVITTGILRQIKVKDGEFEGTALLWGSGGRMLSADAFSHGLAFRGPKGLDNIGEDSACQVYREHCALRELLESYAPPQPSASPPSPTTPPSPSSSSGPSPSSSRAQMISPTGCLDLREVCLGTRLMQTSKGVTSP